MSHSHPPPIYKTLSYQFKKVWRPLITAGPPATQTSQSASTTGIAGPIKVLCATLPLGQGSGPNHDCQTAIVSKIHPFAERSVAFNKLVKQSRASVAHLLKEFRDAPHRSEQAKSFVDELRPYVLRRFVVASAEDLSMDPGIYSSGLRLEGMASYTRRRLLDISLNGAFATARNSLLQGLLEPEDIQVCFETSDTKISLNEIVGLDAAKLVPLIPMLHAGTY